MKVRAKLLISNQLTIESLDLLEKGKEKPIGTVIGKKYEKVAKGKWVPVKAGIEKENDSKKRTA